MIKYIKHWSFIIFILWVFISVFAPFLAAEEALIVKDKNGFAFPVLSNYEPDTSSITFQLNAPIPYSPQSIDYNSTGAIPPFQIHRTQLLQSHWLGTDFIGRDVLANLIHGSRSAFVIGLFSMLLAAFIGICLGGISALNVNNKQKINRTTIIVLVVISLLYTVQVYLLPWEIEAVPYAEKMILFLALTGILILLVFLCLKFFNKRNKTLDIPIDRYITRTIEIIESLPMLFLLVSLNSIIRPSYSSIIMIIALVAWPTFARFSRAEFLKVMNLNYIESAESLGYTKRRILFKHILPNTLSPLLVTFIFGTISAILVESTLTFMGLGLANENASWGEMINMARRDYSAWWLAIFPGAALFFILIALNQMGNKIKQRF